MIMTQNLDDNSDKIKKQFFLLISIIIMQASTLTFVRLSGTSEN
jgi:hypothetical protein